VAGLGSILIIDDSATMRSQLAAILADTFAGVRILEAGNGLEGFKVMIGQLPDLVVCDLVMPDFDGAKFLALRAQKPSLLKIPVIMLTSDSDPDRKVELFDRGAADYVTKPFHAKELAARVRLQWRLKRMSDDLHELNARLETLATTDALTGLSNRRQFDIMLADEVQRTARYQAPLCVLLLDVDHFKHVNDTYGHPMGDEVLRNLGQLILGTLRATDRAARYGGEEIGILLPHTPLEGGLQTAERLRRLAGSTAYVLGEQRIHKTVSIGLHCLTGGQTDTAEVLGRVDEALYAAKRGGRDRVVVWPVE
jgi:two-component system, cell cycle response regulator